MEPVGSLAGVAALRPAAASPRPKEGESDFQVADAPTAAVRAEDIAPASLGGLLAAQESESGAVRDRAAQRRGRDLLAALATLQRALLTGPPDSGSLTPLASLADDMPAADDPQLQAAVAAIALRAKVELARYGMI